MNRQDPQWYKDAILYEVHVRAFHDSAGEGIGDFRGLTQKLDYLQDLGITAIWLLPFYPSPLRDDGYDIADYTNVHADYGTLDDFREFLEEAHSRGLRVITELVINHTSDQHPWFQRARRAPPGSVERDFYVWSDTAEKYADARIIFKDFETSNWSWDKVAGAMYWHRFYSHQPDLNFDNPAVWEALFPLVDYWFEMGVDGLRLDAIPYLFEREGTNCENLPETHEFLKALRRHIDQRFPDRMVLAEANQWPEDSAAYFGNGDECHMAFHFPLMPRLFMAIHREDRLPIIDIMHQTPDIPETCQWAIFLRNHDELTLEMVTDEERDDMYEAYAINPRARINLGIRHRLAPLLGNNRRRIELMNGLLFSFPGSPVLYYGDEIGMGDNIYLGDRNGVRTPMQWSADRNAGFSRANPQQLYLPIIIDPEYHYEAINVESQQRNPNSLLWWVKRLIGLRRRLKALSRGTLEFLQPPNRHILAFLRRHEGEVVLVLANLSRYVQQTEIDLQAFEGVAPVELFGGSRFPTITSQPYRVMLGAHSFYWFMLSGQALSPERISQEDIPIITTANGLEGLKSGSARTAIQGAIARHLRERQHPDLSRTIRVRIRSALPMPGNLPGEILLLDVETQGLLNRSTWLPMVLITEETRDEYAGSEPLTVLAELDGSVKGWLCDATELPRFAAAVASLIHSQQPLRGEQERLVGVVAQEGWPAMPDRDDPRVVRVDGESPAWVVNSSLLLNFLPQPMDTDHPDKEMGRWLSETRRFPHAPEWRGSLELRRDRTRPQVLAEVFSFRPNEGTAWQLTLDELSTFFERILTLPPSEQIPPDSIPERDDPESMLPPAILDALGGYLDIVRLAADRLFDLHQETSAERDDPVFRPETFSLQSQRSVYQSFRTLTEQTRRDLESAEEWLPVDLRPLAREAHALYPLIHERFRRFISQPPSGYRIRIHGDFHLARLLRCGGDFLITGFEGGERTPGARRIKRLPLRDLCTLCHSFEFAAATALNGLRSRYGQSTGVVREEDYDRLSRWAAFWSRLVTEVCYRTYHAQAAGNPILHLAPEEFAIQYDALRLEQSLLEVRRQLQSCNENASAAMEGLLARMNTP